MQQTIKVVTADTSEPMYGEGIVERVTLVLLRSKIQDAEHYRDSQESELRGAFAARRNGTDYYADDDDFMIDVRRRIEAWEHWNDQIEAFEAEIFKHKLKYGNEND